MTSRDRFCDSRKGGTGGDGWVHLKGAHSMAVSGFRFENALVGSEWATAVLLCTNGLRKQSSCLARCPFPMGKHLSQSGRASCQLSAVTIASLLMGGCDLSHECVEDGCKSTCVEFGG